MQKVLESTHKDECFLLFYTPYNHGTSVVVSSIINIILCERVANSKDEPQQNINYSDRPLGLDKR